MISFWVIGTWPDVPRIVDCIDRIITSYTYTHSVRTFNVSLLVCRYNVLVRRLKTAATRCDDRALAGPFAGCTGTDCCL